MTPTIGARRKLRDLHGNVSLAIVPDGARPAGSEVAEKLTPWRVGIKRTIDIAGALVLIVLCAPLLLFLAAMIRLDSRGPLFFAHRRLGRDGEHFDCLKFRSMYEDAEERLFADEHLRHRYVSHDFKIPVCDDPRITRVGRFLRKSSLDELPQLFNVLRGDMSLVGPRPIVALESSHFGDAIDELLLVRPGMTGAWAVSGRNTVQYPERAQMELHYVRTWSLRRDASILMRTPWTVLSQRGAI